MSICKTVDLGPCHQHRCLSCPKCRYGPSFKLFLLQYYKLLQNFDASLDGADSNLNFFSDEKESEGKRISKIFAKKLYDLEPAKVIEDIVQVYLRDFASLMLRFNHRCLIEYETLKNGREEWKAHQIYVIYCFRLKLENYYFPDY